jgi:hypothetical protein
MSKTSQENKAKKAALAQEELSVVEVRPETEEAASANIEVSAETVETEVASQENAQEVESKARAARVRGKKYLAAKKKIDVNKYYPLSVAVKLVKETSLSKFEGKIEAHLVS